VTAAAMFPGNPSGFLHSMIRHMDRDHPTLHAPPNPPRKKINPSDDHCYYQISCSCFLFPNFCSMGGERNRACLGKGGKNLSACFFVIQFFICCARVECQVDAGVKRRVYPSDPLVEEYKLCGPLFNKAGLGDCTN